VKLTGRKSGIIAWLLAVLGIDNAVTFTVYERRIDFTESALSGNLTHSFPMPSIANLGTGFLKPVLNLVLAVGFFVMGIISIPFPYSGFTLAIGWAIAAYNAVMYFLRKSLCVYCTSNSGAGPVVFLKRSVIEGHSLSKEDADKIIGILIRLIEENQRNTKEAQRVMG
jgi:hypothetical protein